MDAVILYCEVNEEFKNRYNECNLEDCYNLESNIRFRSYGVLDLQIRLMRKNMPFINNIFVIVSDETQIPEGFDTDICKFVFHKEIIPGTVLPTFNSYVIEMFIHNIEELDEEFIYFNDDMFVINEMDPEDFFKEGVPCYDFNKNTLPVDDRLREKIPVNCVYNSTRIIKRVLDMYEDSEIIEYRNNGRPLLKSKCKEIFDKIENDIIANCTILREKNNFNINIFSNYNIILRNYHKAIYNAVFLYNDNIDTIINTINGNEKQLLCVNDASFAYFDDFKTYFRIALEHKLNDEEFIREKPRSRKIIVTYSLDENNISNLYGILSAMRTQTYIPDKVVINIPESLDEKLFDENVRILLAEHNDLYEIYKCKKDYKQFNDIYTLRRYPDDIIMTLDIKHICAYNLIEALYKEYMKTDMTAPLCAGNYVTYDGRPCHAEFNVIEKKHYGHYLEDILDDFVYPNLDKYEFYEKIVYSWALRLRKKEYNIFNYNCYKLLKLQYRDDLNLQYVNNEHERIFDNYIWGKYKDVIISKEPAE